MTIKYRFKKATLGQSSVHGRSREEGMVIYLKELGMKQRRHLSQLGWMKVAGKGMEEQSLQQKQLHRESGRRG